MCKLPPARIWLAVCTPSRMTRKQAKHAWRTAWASINPARRVAARVWIDHIAWERKRAAGTVPITEPRLEQLRDYDRFQPAFWRCDELTRTAAPVWVPLTWQHELLLEQDVAGETVARRVYAPLSA